MLSKKIKLRIFLLLFFSLLLAISILFILKNLEENVVYFFSPTEINNKANISFDKKIRIGGLVKENSVNKDGKIVNFIITDRKPLIVKNMNFLLVLTILFVYCPHMTFFI